MNIIAVKKEIMKELTLTRLFMSDIMFHGGGEKEMPKNNTLFQFFILLISTAITFFIWEISFIVSVSWLFNEKDASTVIHVFFSFFIMLLILYSIYFFALKYVLSYNEENINCTISLVNKSKYLQFVLDSLIPAVSFIFLIIWIAITKQNGIGISEIVNFLDPFKSKKNLIYLFILMIPMLLKSHFALFELIKETSEQNKKA